MIKGIMLKLAGFVLVLSASIYSVILLSKLQPFPLVQTSTQSNLESSASTTISIQTPTPTLTPTPLPIPKQAGKSARVPILLYHYIGKNPNPEDKARDNLSVDPEEFDKQMSYLSQNSYMPISFDILYAYLKSDGALPAKPVIITFDDGYMDFYYNAYPILSRYNFHSTVFIPTALMDQGYYLTWAQIKEMDSSGLVSFQSHSVHHTNLLNLSQDRLMYQLLESKNVLQANLGKPANFLAYPYGTSNELTWESAKKAGYLGAVGTWYSTTVSEGTILDMPRVKIPGGISVENFAKRF